jgi:hypothetical protein
VPCNASKQYSEDLHIDPEWVANQYLKRCHTGAWKKGNNAKALKSWNVNSIIDADVFVNSTPSTLAMDELFLSHQQLRHA